MKKIKKKIKNKIGNKNFETLTKFFLFGLGGVALLGIKLISSYVLVDLLDININLAYFITILVVIILGFIYSFYVTFKNKTKILKKFFKYVLSIGLFYALDYVLVLVAINFLEIHYLLSIIIVTIIIFFAKFATYDKLIFKEKNY